VRPARSTGLLYLALAATGAFGSFYAPLAVIVSGDPAATAERVRTSELLVRLGIASELISATLFIFVALALYGLFKGVNQGHAALMVILAVVSVPISFVGVATELGALGLLSGAVHVSAVGPSELELLAYVLLRLHIQTIVVAEIFWGLWLLPLAALVIRSGVVPRAIGVLLVVAGSAYLVGTFISVLVPALAATASIVAVILEAGELSMIWWLLTTRSTASSLAGVVAPA